jgi:hypothetical protein
MHSVTGSTKWRVLRAAAGPAGVRAHGARVDAAKRGGVRSGMDDGMTRAVPAGGCNRTVTGAPAHARCPVRIGHRARGTIDRRALPRSIGRHRIVGNRAVRRGSFLPPIVRGLAR